MARFVTRVCKIRSNRVVAVRTEEPKDLDWEGLKGLVGCRAEDAKLLGTIRQGTFIGSIEDAKTGREKPFVLYNDNKSNDIEWLTEKDPTFESRVKSIFVVEYVRWDGNVVESVQQSDAYKLEIE